MFRYILVLFFLDQISVIITPDDDPQAPLHSSLKPHSTPSACFPHPRHQNRFCALNQSASTLNSSNLFPQLNATPPQILPHSANALAIFPSIHEASLAAQCLNLAGCFPTNNETRNSKHQTPNQNTKNPNPKLDSSPCSGVASSAELFDGKSLRRLTLLTPIPKPQTLNPKPQRPHPRSASVSSGMSRFASTDDDTAAILIETRAGWYQFVAKCNIVTLCVLVGI